MPDDRRAVANALLAQPTDAQGEWTPRRAVRLVTVAHGRVTPTGFDTAVEILVDELRPTDDLDRVPHPGEL